MNPNGQRPVRHVAIIGAGFSGALQAINLLRHEGPSATLIERRGHLARGVAYSAAHPDHLLNVRAANMSALPDDPGHFARWLAATHPEHADGFAPRIVYGDYLGELLGNAARSAPQRLAIRSGEAVDVAFSPDGATVQLADGSQIAADAVILAPGNLPPHQPPELAAAALDPDLYAPDPWAGDIAEGLADDDVVLVIGSGLTMVDVALLLDARGFRGRIIALSRRGLLPRAHAPIPPSPTPRLSERPSLCATELLGFVRDRAEAIGWRAAVDELRPYTQDMWLAAAPEDRGRFLRHLRPWWDVHRHRLAPQVAARVAALQASGRLEVVAGKLASVSANGRTTRVAWRARGRDDLVEVATRRIVNCSGPQGDLNRTAEPLLRALIDRGLIQPDPLRLGIQVNQQAEVIDATGNANPRLLALGPMTRGAFWEIVAVPDIRVQTWSVARRLSNAHWVGGEGL
ncbi:FAD-dependent oxidoreductase [Sphingomonas sp. DBB INV C78]